MGYLHFLGDNKMNIAKFYVEVEIPNDLIAIENMFRFLKSKSAETTYCDETPIIFTGNVKDKEGYFVTNNSPYLLGGCWPVEQKEMTNGNK
jgi:hypothetical protein